MWTRDPRVHSRRPIRAARKGTTERLTTHTVAVLLVWLLYAVAQPAWHCTTVVDLPQNCISPTKVVIQPCRNFMSRVTTPLRTCFSTQPWALGYLPSRPFPVSLGQYGRGIYLRHFTPGFILGRPAQVAWQPGSQAVQGSPPTLKEAAAALVSTWHVQIGATLEVHLARYRAMTALLARLLLCSDLDGHYYL